MKYEPEADYSQWQKAVSEHRALIEAREQENLDLTKKFFSEHEEGLTALHAIHLALWRCHVNTRDKTPPDGALSFLAFRAANDLLAAWCLMARGHYVAAWSMFRAVLEGWISIVYFHHFPDDAVLWWKTDPTPQEEDRIKVGQMRRRLEEAGYLDPEVRTLYRVLSSMTHPTADSIYPGLIKKEANDEKQIEFSVVGQFDKSKTLYHASAAMILGVNLAKLMAGVLKGAIGGPESPYKSIEEMNRYLNGLAYHFKLEDDLLTLSPEDIYGIQHDSQP